ncbi:hypothetical protein MSUIS_07500 [Mycoplasma suis KI3806]|uniref:Uncharacterized protein n=1 Tax=Mycoplasma suis (strain KI_3806) TaxID=708248 RepID=F0V2G2_MYCS3|nr:hypothetical protein [Mycoplasma suis]CBZ40843.1 hypothetical protein MSUIS_07500 [Mycoplasma suis KI3806]
MIWKWAITLLGVPLGINLGSFLPQIDGVRIGKEGIKVKTEDIDLDNKEKLSEVLGSNVDLGLDSSNIELSIPCMDGDFVGEWIKNIRKWAPDEAIKTKVNDIEEIMKEVANTLYGCKSWFEKFGNKNQKEKAINRRIKRFSEDSSESSGKEKNFKFGLNTKFVKTESSIEKSEKLFNGIQVEFKKMKRADENESKRLSDAIYQILLKSIEQVLREGKWSKNVLLQNTAESQYKTSSDYYPTEKTPENQWIRDLIEKCAHRCLFSPNGIQWNPQNKNKGVAAWFAEKMKSDKDDDKKMGIKDVLMSLNFSWTGIKPILEQVIWNNVYKWESEGKQFNEQSKCWVGGWGLVCPKGGVIWGK